MKIKHEEVMNQLKKKILEIEDVKSVSSSLTLTDRSLHYILVVESIDNVRIRKIFNVHTEIEYYIDKYGVDYFCNDLCEYIKSKLKIERTIKEITLPQKYVEPFELCDIRKVLTKPFKNINE